MASLARSGWRRAKSSIANEVEARTVPVLLERQDEASRQLSEIFVQLSEILRQSTDVFKEIARLSAIVDDLGRKLADLTETVGVQVDVENQSTELVGRLLAQARARLDALEEAGQHA